MWEKKEIDFTNKSIEKTIPHSIKYKQIRIVNHVLIQVTGCCNLDCSYCFQKSKTHDRLSLNDYKRIFDLLFNDHEDKDYFEQFKIEEYPNGYFVLYFIGGEPLLEINNISLALEYFEEKLKLHHMEDLKWRVSFVTNGTVYMNKKVQTLLNKYKDKIWMSISLDGYTKQSHDLCRKFKDGSGSFVYAQEAIRDFKSRNYDDLDHKRRMMKYVISKKNLPYLEDSIYNFMLDNFSFVSSGLVVEENWTIDDARSYYQQLKRIADMIIKTGREESFEYNVISQREDINYIMNESEYCNDQRCSIHRLYKLSIGSNGNFIACAALDKNSIGDDELSYGNIYTGECITLKEKAVYNYLYGGFQQYNSLTYKCLYCTLLNRCAGCKAINYKQNKDLRHCTSACNMYVAEYLANIYFINQLYLNGYYDTHEINNLTGKILLPMSRCIPIIGEEDYEYLTNIYRGRILCDV